MGEWSGKNWKKKLVWVAVLAILGSLGIGFWQTLKLQDGKLHLVFCDVGQGDAIYLKVPSGQEVLIDGGPDEKVLDCLSSHRPFYDREIEVVILTHPEADHLTGLISVLERYTVDYLVIENISLETEVFKRFRQAVIGELGENLEIYNPKEGDRLKLGETEINFFWPKEVIGKKDLWAEKEGENGSVLSSPAGNPNDYSLVFEVKYKDFNILQSGDAESAILEQALSFPLEIEVLKVPHHGSKGSLSAQILNLVKPELAVISVGRKNRFGHPRQETLDLLKDWGVKTLRTDEEGEVEIVSDGQNWQVD